MSSTTSSPSSRRTATASAALALARSATAITASAVSPSPTSTAVRPVSSTPSSQLVDPIRNILEQGSSPDPHRPAVDRADHSLAGSVLEVGHDGIGIGERREGTADGMLGPRLQRPGPPEQGIGVGVGSERFDDLHPTPR